MRENRYFIDQVQRYIDLPDQDAETWRSLAQRVRMGNDKLFAAMKPSGGGSVQ